MDGGDGTGRGYRRAGRAARDVRGGAPRRPPFPGDGRPRLIDGLRFAFGTLTVVPVRLTRWDRDAARVGMLCAVLPGLLVGVCAAVLGGAVLALDGGTPLGAVAATAVPAVLTRGLHLDGLADTADGLGSGRPAREALRVMKRSDIGPFGVLTLLFVLLAQVAAVHRLYEDSWARGSLAIVLAAVLARTALCLACRAGVPAARPDGLGAAVAGVLPRAAAFGLACGVLLVTAASGVPSGRYAVLRHALAALAALAAAEGLLRRCRRRLGGVTGDVFGAVAETASCVSLVGFALG